MTIDLTTLMLFLFCDICGVTTNYRFIKDDGKYEFYRCDKCGHEVSYAVR